MQVPERHQRNHIISCSTWMSPLPRKSPSRRSHCSVSLSRCVMAWIPMPLKTNLLISLHTLINAKESVWNHPAHSWLFCVSVISTTHTVTAVATLRLSLPNNLLALMGHDPAPSSPAHLSPSPKPHHELSCSLFTPAFCWHGLSGVSWS